jgi:prepilin-type N-terminal cleavage/methylation domain-containing protein
MQKKILKNNKGFTLIELLVVVAIIGLLSSVVLASLNSARAKGRDARRKMDIEQMRNALVLYFDANGKYPNCGLWSESTDATWNTTGCLITALSPFIPTLPVDPKNNSASPWGTGNYSYFYGVRPGLQDYDLGGQLEVQTDRATCQFQMWPFHYYGPNAAAWCSATYGYSPYMYLDHF